MEKKLTKLDFKEEIKTMAISCIGVKEATAKRKASAIFRKYEDIISFSESWEEYFRARYFRERNVTDALRTGRVRYKRENVEGVLSIRDIEQVEVRKENVLLTTKAGREISLGKDFEFLKDIF